jgi:hypothetical protein
MESEIRFGVGEVVIPMARSFFLQLSKGRSQHPHRDPDMYSLMDLDSLALRGRHLAARQSRGLPVAPMGSGCR